MNKSKLISVAVLCALALGACVDDKESTSVTALREAKTSYLKAQADYQTAQAEVARINAEVAKAKAEAEAEVAKLKAQAEAAKTEAEAAVYKQQAEEAAKRLEVQLAELEAQAKANAAQYEKQYQEYLNELAQAKRDAEKQKQYDLSQIVGKYQTSLGNIKGYEETIQQEELNKLKAEQKKMQVLAGEAYAKVKNDSIDKDAALKYKETELRELEVLYEADAKKQKEIVEEKRAGLTEQVQKVNEAYVAMMAKNQEIYVEDGPNTQLNNLKDSLREGWRILNYAESGQYYTENGNWISIPGHNQSITGYGYDYKNIKYYKWEADRLITDIKVKLDEVTAEFKKADTLGKAEANLEKLFTAFEKAEKEYNEAVEAQEKAVKANADAQTKATEANDALITAQNKLANLPADATAAQKQAAQDAVDAADAVKKAADKAAEKTQTALEAANTALNDATIAKEQANTAYVNERDHVNALKVDIESKQMSVENYTEMLENVTAAVATCFGKLNDEIAAAQIKVDELSEQYDELRDTYNTLNAEYSTDKTLVNDWDLTVGDNNEYDPNDDYSEFLTKVEKKIITAKGAIETLKVQLAHLAEMMSNPDNIIDEYYSTIQDEITAAENAIATAQESLDKEKLLANEYKASIEAWMTGAAE